MTNPKAEQTFKDFQEILLLTAGVSGCLTVLNVRKVLEVLGDAANRGMEKAEDKMQIVSDFLQFLKDCDRVFGGEAQRSNDEAGL